MCILNLASDGLPSVLVALVRTLDSEGPMPRQKLLDLCAPETLHEEKPQRQARQTLTRWTQIGLFEEKEDRVSLAKPFKGLTDMRGFSGFRWELLKLVLDAPQAEDFNEAAAWILQEDIYQLPSSHSDIDALQIKRMKDVFLSSGERAFQNNTRWNGMRAWGEFLGLGLPFGGFTVDVTPPVQEVLSRLLPRNGLMATADVLEAIAKHLPILDGGAFQEEIRMRLKNCTVLSENQLTPALSAALLRLEHEEKLQMPLESDAIEFELTGRKYTRLKRLTHFKRGEAL